MPKLVGTSSPTTKPARCRWCVAGSRAWTLRTMPSRAIAVAVATTAITRPVRGVDGREETTPDDKPADDKTTTAPRLVAAKARAAASNFGQILIESARRRRLVQRHPDRGGVEEEGHRARAGPRIRHQPVPQGAAGPQRVEVPLAVGHPDRRPGRERDPQPLDPVRMVEADRGLGELPVEHDPPVGRRSQAARRPYVEEDQLLELADGGCLTALGAGEGPVEHRAGRARERGAGDPKIGRRELVDRMPD